MGSDEIDKQGYEEQLTEDELLARMDIAHELSSRVGKLFFEKERDKATPEQATMWKHLALYLDHLAMLTDLILQVKLIDRFDALPSGDKEQLLRKWASAPEDSYDNRKYHKFNVVRSREGAINIVRELRAELKSESVLNCKAMRAFGFSEESVFWPGHLDSPIRAEPTKKKRSRAPIDESTEFRKLIASILVRKGFRQSSTDIAKQIPANNRDIEEQYLDKTGAAKTLYDTLRRNQDLRDKFSKLVSDVKATLKTEKTRI
jgi:hypothetical protein